MHTLPTRTATALTSAAPTVAALPGAGRADATPRRFARATRHEAPTAGHDGSTARDAAPTTGRDGSAARGTAPTARHDGSDRGHVVLRVVGNGEVPVEHVVRAAARGEQAAWDELVRRYAGLVRAVARAHRLSPADAADVYQATWTRLVENLARLHNPAGVGAWLATTARRECLHTLRRSARETPSEELPEPTTSGADLDRRLIAAERDAALWRAFSTLPERDQVLLRALSDDTERSYAEIGDALQMPIGSIGPTRARSLGRLRKALEQTGGIDALAA